MSFKTKKQPSVMEHQFSKTPSVSNPRSTFNRSHGVKTTFDSGYLYPIFIDEVLPGDTHNLKTAGFARMSTPIFPVMDNMYLETFYFFVPLRLLWSNFQKMMGEQTDPDSSTDYTTPQVDLNAGTGVLESTLFDYLGVPTNAVGANSVSAYYSRAYNLIWNEWFRDQNIQDSLTVDQGDGPDAESDYILQRRGKRHDYFTSCLPWPQKGEEVMLPIGDSAPVKGIGQDVQTYTTAGKAIYETNATGTRVYAQSAGFSTADAFMEEDPDNTGFPHIYADLASATSSTINAIRQAFQLQKMFERDARGGTRYTEIIKSHFGVNSPDARLQRPEYLGGGSVPINITPIPQTSESSITAQGTLAATGTANFQNHGFVKSFTEHGIIIGLVNVRADITYQQGLNKMFSRADRFDYYWPSLAHIGEQAVLNKEIYMQTGATDELVFGYQERYAEYRYKPSTIHGVFRSNAATPLDAWHLAQDFGSLPTLSPSFIQDDPPMDRVIAVNTEPQFIADFYHQLTSARPMPVYGVPGLIDHF